MKGLLKRLKPRESSSASESGETASIWGTKNAPIHSQGYIKPLRSSRISPSLGRGSAADPSAIEAEYVNEIERLRQEVQSLQARLGEAGASQKFPVHTLHNAPPVRVSLPTERRTGDEVTVLAGAVAVALDRADALPTTRPQPNPALATPSGAPLQLLLPPGRSARESASKVMSVGNVELSEQRRRHLAQLMAVPIDVVDATEADRAMSTPNSPREGQRLRRERQRRRQLIDKAPESPGGTPTRAAAAKRPKFHFSPAKTAPVGGSLAQPRSALPPTRIDTSAPERAVQLSELVMLRPLGTGGYGAVGLARLPRTEVVYAVKAVSKAHVTSAPSGGPAAVMRLRRERDALFALQGHPCVLRLDSTHADAGHVYLVTEACMGGELLRLLRASLLSAEDAAFYAAGVVLALQAAHARGIAHRDIKPENVLIDASGFVRLADWGAAVFVGTPDSPGDAKSGGRTLTRFGTLEYMSPEVARGKGVGGDGHTLETDWWSLGALIFEMLVGRTPCVGAAQDTDQDVLKRIARGEVIWPREGEQKLTPVAADLLAGLLRRDETKRLGARGTGGAEAVRKHPFFANISFSAIANRSGIQPPWRPELGASDDNSFSPGATNPGRFVEMLNSALGAQYDAEEWDPHFADF